MLAMVARLSSGLVRGSDVQNTVDININLRDTSGCKRNADLPTLVDVFAAASTLSFVHLNNTPGCVRVSREYFEFFDGNGGVLLDESGHDSSSSFDTDGKRATLKTKSS
jgi:NAD-specific glutamate dehydrogenase